MRKQYYITDKAKNADLVQFAIFATPNGFLVTPTEKKTDTRQILNYDLFYEDIFLTSEKAVLQKIKEETVIANKLENKNLCFMWAIDVDKEIAQIVITNKPICDSFDRE